MGAEKFEPPDAPADAYLDALLDSAARLGFVETLRAHPELTVEQLRRLYEHTRATEAVYPISLRQLTRPHAEWSDVELGQEIRAYFSCHPRDERSSVYFQRRFAIPRWRAQKLLRQLADAGHLDRRGEFFNTRYTLPAARARTRAAVDESGLERVGGRRGQLS
ncbi:MAG: hypothetical protein HC927_03690 [Deltaproteobacteria bacterium]|nr:hypothetical protein [Deltaproteobacteria bacterium]